MKKSIYFIILSIFIMTLAGCAKEVVTDNGQSNISLSKDRTVIYRIRDDFEENYYNIDELSQMISEEASVYNSKYGDSKVTLNKAEVNGSKTDVEILFATGEDYSRFNGESLFVGTGADYLASGRDSSVVLHGVKDESKSISGEDITSMVKETIVVVDSSDTIFLPAKAKYVSNNCEVSEDYRSVTRKSGTEGAVYVVYK